MAKLALGTAQFGSDYGVKKDGQPSLAEIKQILSIARRSGIDMIDTAPAYNLPAIDFTGFKVVQKTPYGGRAYALLHHNPDGDIENLLWARGRVEKVGVSVYTVEQMERALHADIDIIQLPLSIADNRFIPHLAKLRERGIEIHARSVFLQGALLIGKGVPKMSVEKCLGFALYQDVDYVVVGANNVKQLRELLKVEPKNYEGLNITDERVIDPRKWEGAK